MLEADYPRQLHFQLTQDGLASASGAEETATDSASLDALKVASRTKAKSIRQNLNGSTFTNFQHVHPAFKLFILKCIHNFHTTKKEIQEDISFYQCMSVSAFHLLFSKSWYQH